MNRIRTWGVVASAIVGVLGAHGAPAQDDTAAERARIANERIRRDMELRTRAEDPAPAPTPSTPASLPLAATRPAPVAEAPVVTPSGTSSTGSIAPAPATAMEAGSYSQTLEQLRVLGQLRDAGYLTDDEFTRIKTRIISSVF
ncbi:MAG: SHOCT domain-containing protein [Pseudomonadota bacterium]